MKTSQAMQRLREVIRRQHKSLSTEDSYVLWLRRYMGALPDMPDDLPSERKLERFLTTLAIRHSLSASTQNQAFNAVVFFYREVLCQPLGTLTRCEPNNPFTNAMRHLSVTHACCCRRSKTSEAIPQT